MTTVTILAQADDTQLAYRRWWQMRQSAIEAGLIAERVLIEAGEMKPDDRRIITRKESRYENNMGRT
jgi:hypothetical protein